MEKLEKYYIRPIIMQDLPYLNTWKNDKEIFQYLGGGYKPTSIDEQRKWMDSLISSSSSMRFMIVDKQINLPIGMTGLTQVTVRNSVPWDERIPIDVEYVDKFNVWLDIKIIFKTLQKIFKKESIYTQVEKEAILDSKTNLNV